jgi:CheY-like chemotaxis protein
MSFPELSAERNSGTLLGTRQVATTPSTGRLRILIVDDNEDAANTLGRLLTLMGKDVRVVHDGPKAIAEAVRFQPRVVLLDLGMPGMDGIETARHIRARPAGRDVILVALTGWGQDQDRQRTEEAGFAAHFVKPVNLEQLESLLGKLTNS